MIIIAHLLLPSAFGTIGVKLSGSSLGLIKSVDLLLVIYGSMSGCLCLCVRAASTNRNDCQFCGFFFFNVSNRLRYTPSAKYFSKAKSDISASV
uniref:Uncharacterized protein n=1 Tax=Glossina palpalis gambiensis TaxID=67801 RepID=A0A1B0C5Y6_9MUSC